MDGNLAMANQAELHPDNPEVMKNEITEALIKKRFYNPYNVFHHAPEFYPCTDERYKYEVHVVKWNTKSARVTILYARYNDKKKQWILHRKKGVPRQKHGEKMR